MIAKVRQFIEEVKATMTSVTRIMVVLGELREELIKYRKVLAEMEAYSKSATDYLLEIRRQVSDIKAQVNRLKLF